MRLTVQHTRRVYGDVTVPGDKSITHRALLLGALGEGTTRIAGYLDSGDCRATIGCLRALGVGIEAQAADSGAELLVHGAGLHGLREPAIVLDCMRSGTTMRLLSGLLAGQRFYSVLSGDPQLLRRPMDRVVAPLRRMGARVHGRDRDQLPPLTLVGSQLRGVDYELPVASAQVKSCILLAGLYAEGLVRVTEPGPSRDHTERMLRGRGVDVVSRGLEHHLRGPVARLASIDTTVPGDISSAAYLIAAGLLAEEGEVTIRNVGVNPTRTGLLDVLEAMGAAIERKNPKDQGGEPVADLVVRPSELRGVEVAGDLVPRMIDEFPILALLATQARGTTRVRDAAELRVKEGDRIASITRGLCDMGAQIVAHPDGFDVEGPTALRGVAVSGGGDHRLAMTLAVAGLVAQGETVIVDSESIADSFPGFFARLNALTGGAAS